ncbi:hypothetical protein CO610_07345 [Lysobacteraceae bacterium NML95-0200]|nr:hypothetical protein CO610_07345 [Xanthomonadaceae bacterium NML95-0200]
MWDGLQQFISKEVRPRGAQCLWINGSFTRSKSVPADIDIVIDICDWDEPKALELMLHIFRHHDAFKSAYHVDAHVRHPSIPNDLAKFFQYAGHKCASELHLDIHHKKGILRVQL